MPKRFVLVAGESSGDRLGAGLIQAIKKQHPDAIFEGVGGPLMEAAGCHCFYPSERLAYMGLIDPLLHLPDLYRIFRHLVRHCRQNPPDVYIGIDSPDFTLRVAAAIKKTGIKIAHYVGPSVWAWRAGRIKKIKKIVDHMMVLFPFEESIYQENGVPVTTVGLTLADELPLDPDQDRQAKARSLWNFSDETPVVTLLAGSRKIEWKYMLKPFIQAAALVKKARPDVRFLAPTVSETGVALWKAALAENPDAPAIEVFVGKAEESMIASNAVLATSGTVTLEAMLLKCPMVIAYCMAPFNYWVAKKVIRVPYIGLPNLLAKKMLVPEYIQEGVQPEKLANHLLEYLSSNTAQKWLPEYRAIHKILAKSANEKAAEVVLSL